jgi:hypothetical protein
MTARISDLLGNEEERSRLAANGRRLVEQKWTWAKVAQKYRCLLNDNSAGNTS